MREPATFLNGGNKEEGMKDIWSEEANATLRRLWAEGATTSQIGRVVGRTKNAVIGRVRRLGLEQRPNPVGNGFKGGGRTGKSASRRPVPIPLAQLPPVQADRAWMSETTLPPIVTPVTTPPPRRRNQCLAMEPGPRPRTWIQCDGTTEHGQSWCPDCRARVFQRPRIADAAD